MEKKSNLEWSWPHTPLKLVFFFHTLKKVAVLKCECSLWLIFACVWLCRIQYCLDLYFDPLLHAFFLFKQYFILYLWGYLITVCRQHTHYISTPYCFSIKWKIHQLGYSLLCRHSFGLSCNLSSPVSWNNSISELYFNDMLNLLKKFTKRVKHCFQNTNEIVLSTLP